MTTWCQDRKIVLRHPIRVIPGLDLSDLNSVQTFAEQFVSEETGLDVLINNAGVVADNFAKSPQGHEIMLATNHLGVFHLTNLLLPLLKHNQPSRIINLSSDAHYMYTYTLADLLYEFEVPLGTSLGLNQVMKKYAQTKTANVLHLLELTRIFKEEGTQITTYAVHPGAVNTNLGSSEENSKGFIQRWILPIVRWFFTTPYDGATSSFTAATSPELSGESGIFLNQKGVKVDYAPHCTQENATALWAKSEELVGLWQANK